MMGQIVFWNNEEAVPRLQEELEDVRWKITQVGTFLLPVNVATKRRLQEQIEDCQQRGLPIELRRRYNGDRYISVKAGGLSYSFNLYRLGYYEPLCVTLGHVNKVLPEAKLYPCDLSPASYSLAVEWLNLQDRREQIEWELEERGYHATLDVRGKADRDIDGDGYSHYRRV